MGSCKTRLAATLGDSRALEVYRFLLRHTEGVAEALEGTDRYVYFSDSLGDGSHWDVSHFTHCLQHGEDLGARMQKAFEAAFSEGYQRVCLIGSDLYDLRTRDLEEAFRLLESHEAVVGPAQDGGYYLLGLTRMFPGLFTAKKWGTSSVLSDTLNSLKGRAVAALPVRNDIDYYEDIAGHPDFEPFLKDLHHD